jgi:hypothetical protein
MPSADDVVWELALVLVVNITVHRRLAQYLTDNQAIYAMGKTLLNSKYYKMLKKSIQTPASWIQGRFMNLQQGMNM